MARKVKKVKEVDGVGGAGTAGEPNARVVMTEARRVVPPRVAHRCAEMARRAAFSTIVPLEFPSLEIV